MFQFRVIAPPRCMAGVADERDTAYAPGVLVARMYNALYGEARAIDGAVSPELVFDVAYLATVNGWTVEQAFRRLQKDAKERV